MSAFRNRAAENLGPDVPRTGIIPYFALNGVAANLLLAFLLISGILAFQNMVQEILPDSSLDTVQARVVYPGATPEEIEESVVQKIEEAVQSVEGVERIDATAQENQGVVNIELQRGTDTARALDEIKSEVDQIQTFPVDAEEPEVRELTTRQSVIRIAVYGDQDERTLKELAYRLEDALSALPEVSYVETSSIRAYEVSVEVSQAALRNYGLSLNDVARTVRQSSQDTPAGVIDTESETVRVRTIGQNYTQTDFEDIVLVSRANGATVRLGDVASIKDAFEDSDLVPRYNGQPVTFVEVFRTSDERVLDVAQAVYDYLEEDFAAAVPAGVSYSVWEDQSQYLDSRLGLLLKNGAIGLVLVLLALTLFLDLRLACWTAVGLFAVFAGALFVLQMIGASINMFSVFGFILAIGLVVDDAIVVGENVYAQREAGRSGSAAAILGTNRVLLPVIFAVLTTIAAFAPLFSISGVIGELLSDIPRVVTIVLLLSLIESLFILPNHLSSLPKPDIPPGNRVTRAFSRVQQFVDRRLKQFVDGPLDRALQFCMRMPLVAVAAAVALMILTFSLVPGGLLKVAFFPELEGDLVSVQIEMPAGTPVDQTRILTERIEAAGREAVAEIAAGRPEDAPELLEGIYTTVGGSVGQQGPEGQVETGGSNLATIQIKLLRAEDRDVSSKSLENLWRDKVGPTPEASSVIFSSSLFSIGEPVNVKLTHPNPDTLTRASERVMAELATFDGVFDIQSDEDAGLREIRLSLKPEARTLGVTLEDVASQVRAAFFGNEALRVQRGREDVRVYIRLPEDERNSIADVEAFRVRVPGGEVALRELADVRFDTAPSVIRREDGKRAVSVTADIDADVVTGQEITTQLDRKVMPEIVRDFPELKYHFGGEQEEQAKSFGDLGFAFLIAMLVIYTLLAIPFRSYLQPLIILSAVPFGIVGALLGHLILGIPVGVLSIFGIIGLSGVIVNDALVMLDFINEKRADGYAAVDAIVAGAKSRFRPIVLTSLTTFLGVAPITFETSIQAQFLIPMAASLGFGILFGTVLLMLLVPTLAIIEAKAQVRIARWRDERRARKEALQAGA